jgi:chromosomal replication initiation ATPase DnaA
MKRIRAAGRRDCGPAVRDEHGQAQAEKPLMPPRRARVLERLEFLGARALAQRTASEFGVALGTVLQGKSRSRSVIRARHRIWCLIRHTLDLSYPEMERLFEVDHTTIVVAVRKRERELEGEERGRG